MLNGKTAIITGGARGLGRATVLAFSNAGARVIAVDRDGDELARLDVPGLSVVTADVSSPIDADRIVAAAAPDVDVLVNCAAVLDRLALADETDEAQWQRVIDINLTGPYLLCKRVIPLMIERGGGVIINVASTAGLRGGRAGAAYTASKHGLVGLTQNIAATLGRDGIRAITVAPGGMSTGMDRGGELSERAARIAGRDRDRPEAGTPEEVADVIVFLASDGARRMNGSVVTVDGGSTAY